MDPLSCDNAIYEDIETESSINIFENQCYGKVTSSENITKQDGVKKNHSCSKVIIMVFVIVFALLLGTAGACVAFGVQITTLKTEMSSLQMASSSQNTFTDTLEEVVHQLNTSNNMLYQQLSQQNASIDSAYQQLNEQLNTSIDMLYQQLSQQNASINSAYLQLNEVYRQLNTSNNMLYHQLSQQNTSIDSAYQQLNEQLNTSIDMLYYQLSQQNASIDSTYRQLNEQLNTSNNMLYQQLSQQNASLGSAYQQLRQEYSALDNRTQELNTSTQFLYNGLFGHSPFYPADSCVALPPSSPSGYYWVRASNGSAVSVYCDMTRSCGGVTGGWMRVAELDMTNSNYQCPSNLMERNDLGKRTCVRIESGGGCSSVDFITPGVEYSSVCGRVLGYQYGIPEAFTSISVDSKYVDGVSLTHGHPRQHIWTFAAAQDEVGTIPSGNCPCINTNQVAQTTPPPAFVGNDYFCDTASEERVQVTFYGDDPLWDGAGCGPLNTCCSFNTPPWFYKQLPQPTTDDIEMRVCRDFFLNNEDIAIEIVEVYVQ